VATWTASAGRVVLTPLEEIATDDAAALERDAADVERFLGTTGGPAAGRAAGPAG
jgi:hypothetical protein